MLCARLLSIRFEQLVQESFWVIARDVGCIEGEPGSVEKPVGHILTEFLAQIPAWSLYLSRRRRAKRRFSWVPLRERPTQRETRPEVDSLSGDWFGPARNREPTPADSLS